MIDTYIFLLANVLVKRWVPNMSLNRALHHCASIVILNVALPSRLWQVMILREALLSEIFNRVVVCIGQEVVYLLRLCMVFELVHQAWPVAFDLLLSRDGQKDDLCKLLRVERSEDTAAENLRLLPLLLLNDDHSLVYSVHHKSDDVGAGHPRELLRDNIL